LKFIKNLWSSETTEREFPEWQYLANRKSLGKMRKRLYLIFKV